MPTLLRFIHISDTHYAPADYVSDGDYRYHPNVGVAALLETLKALPYRVDFILHTGDVAYDPHPAIYTEIQTAFSALPAPVLYVPGNHDHNATLQTVLMGRAEVQVPLYYERELNGVRLIFLDTNGEAPPPAGHVSAEQIAWLGERLALEDTRPIVVAFHHPLVATGTSEWFDVFMRTTNGEAVHQVLATAAPRIRGAFFGHVHQDIEFYRDGVLYTSVRSSWRQFETRPDQDMGTLDTPSADPGYALVTITDTGTIIQRFPFRVG